MTEMNQNILQQEIPLTNPQNEAEQKAVDEALYNARQNTAKGQFYSQIVSVIAFLIFICSVCSYGALHVYNMFGDKTVQIPRFLFGSDFHLDLSQYLKQEQRTTVTPYLTNHWHDHDFRHDFYACQSIQPKKQFNNITYQFIYTTKLSDDGLKFSIPPGFNSSYVKLELEYNNDQEVVLKDKICISDRVETCKQIHELADTNLRSVIVCNSTKACTFTIKLISHHLSLFTVTMKLTAEQQQLSTSNCRFIPHSYNFENYTWLLVKSNLNVKLLREAPDLHVEHQSPIILFVWRTICLSTGVVLLVSILLLYRKSKQQWEQKIQEKILQDVRNKQKVQSHIDKIKQAMKQEKEK